VTPDTNAVSTVILAGLLLLIGLFAAVYRVAGMRRMFVEERP
jgi:hypothetical protein